MTRQPEVVKQSLIDAVLEYCRDPFKFELRCIFDQTYDTYPAQWDEITDQHMRGDSTQ